MTSSDDLPGVPSSSSLLSGSGNNRRPAPLPIASRPSQSSESVGGGGGSGGGGRGRASVHEHDSSSSDDEDESQEKRAHHKRQPPAEKKQSDAKKPELTQRELFLARLARQEKEEEARVRSNAIEAKAREEQLFKTWEANQTNQIFSSLENFREHVTQNKLRQLQCFDAIGKIGTLTHSDLRTSLKRDVKTEYDKFDTHKTQVAYVQDRIYFYWLSITLQGREYLKRFLIKNQSVVAGGVVAPLPPPPPPPPAPAKAPHGNMSSAIWDIQDCSSLLFGDLIVDTTSSLMISSASSASDSESLSRNDSEAFLNRRRNHGRDQIEQVKQAAKHYHEQIFSLRKAAVDSNLLHTKPEFDNRLQQCEHAIFLAFQHVAAELSFCSLEASRYLATMLSQLKDTSLHVQQEVELRQQNQLFEADDKQSDYSRHLQAVCKKARERGLVRIEGFVWEPIESQGYRTGAYRLWRDTQETIGSGNMTKFIERCAMGIDYGGDQALSAEIRKLNRSTPRAVDNVAKELTKETTLEPLFPSLQFNREYIAFRNGIFHLNKNEFFEFTLPRAGSPDLNKIAIPLYFDVDFDEDGYEYYIQKAGPKKPGWFDIPVDIMDKIPKVQEWPEDEQMWWYAMGGRMLFPIGLFDTWAKMAIHLGRSGSGKGTSLKLWMTYIPPGRIGILPNRMERVFGLSALAHSYAWFGIDVTGNWNIDWPTLFLIIDGGYIPDIQKYNKPGKMWFDAHGAICANILDVPHLSAPLMRRAFTHHYTRVPQPGEFHGNMEQDFKNSKQVAAGLKKIVSAYFWFTRLYGKKQLTDDILPPSLQFANKVLGAHLNVMSTFVHDATEVQQDPLLISNQQHFADMFEFYARCHGGTKKKRGGDNFMSETWRTTYPSLGLTLIDDKRQFIERHMTLVAKQAALNPAKYAHLDFTDPKNSERKKKLDSLVDRIKFPLYTGCRVLGKSYKLLQTYLDRKYRDIRISSDNNDHPSSSSSSSAAAAASGSAAINEKTTPYMQNPHLFPSDVETRYIEAERRQLSNPHDVSKEEHSDINVNQFNRLMLDPLVDISTLV
jgi:hypothetical protein